MPIGRLYEAPSIHFTPVLNAGLKFEELDHADQDSFTGLVEKVKLPAGFRLYKFTEYDIQSAHGVTPYWSPVERYQGRYQTDEGLHERLRQAQQQGLSPADYARVVAAVRTNWNNLTNILTAFLLKDVYAFWGAISAQPKFGDQPLEHMRKFDKVLAELLQKFEGTARMPQRITLPGGAGQFFIPHLECRVHIQRSRRVPVADVISGREWMS